MFERVYQNMKVGYKQSWLRLFFKYTALGKLLEQDTQITAFTFFDTYLSSWRWNRLWFRTCIQQEENLSRFDRMLEPFSDLKKAELLTQANFTLAANHAEPGDLSSMLRYLQRSSILTQANFTLVANHPNPRELASALANLETASILTQGNFNLVSNRVESGHLITMLGYLKEVGLLTQANFNLIANRPESGRLIYILRYLKEVGLLTQANFILVANRAESGRLIYILRYLQEVGLLTQANFNLAANRTESSRLVYILRYLQEVRILTQENFILVVNHLDLQGLFSALYYLRNATILTQENFAILTAPNHTALVSQESNQLIWSRIPPGLLTQAHFDRLVTASEDANPMAALQRVRDQILALNLLANHNLLGVQPGHAAFNQAQSTHTASVHRSVSESAARLMNSYGAGLDLEAAIKKIKTYINSLDNSFKHLAAKRGIKRIASPYDTFTDSSGVTTRQLLALAYTAIHDETKRQGKLEDAQALFVDGLYEIQRGYNLSAEGIDNQNTEDAPICSAGTFNKLVEKLNGIHQDVEVYFITHEGLCLKFPKVVEECALNYLNDLTSPESATDYLKIKELLDGIKDKGLEPIWDKIKSAVEAKLWDEFKEAYANKPENSRFRAMIEYGYDSNAPDLIALYSRLEASPGYKAFLYQLAQNSLGAQKLFLSLAQHGLWANRHNSAENQDAFDRQYGLVLKMIFPRKTGHQHYATNPKSLGV